MDILMIIAVILLGLYAVLGEVHVRVVKKMLLASNSTLSKYQESFRRSQALNNVLQMFIEHQAGAFKKIGSQINSLYVADILFLGRYIKMILKGGDISSWVILRAIMEINDYDTDDEKKMLLSNAVLSSISRTSLFSLITYSLSNDQSAESMACCVVMNAAIKFIGKNDEFGFTEKQIAEGLIKRANEQVALYYDKDLYEINVERVKTRFSLT